MITNGDLIREQRRRALAESRILREGLERVAPPRTDLTYRFTITCPRCGGPVRHVTGTPAPRGVAVEGRVVVECGPCRSTIVIVVQLTASGEPEHGTNAGYARHLRRGESACSECKAAHARHRTDANQLRRKAMA